MTRLLRSRGLRDEAAKSSICSNLTTVRRWTGITLLTHFFVNPLGGAANELPHAQTSLPVGLKTATMADERHHQSKSVQISVQHSSRKFVPTLALPLPCRVRRLLQRSYAVTRTRRRHQLDSSAGPHDRAQRTGPDQLAARSLAPRLLRMSVDISHQVTAIGLQTFASKLWANGSWIMAYLQQPKGW